MSLPNIDIGDPEKQYWIPHQVRDDKVTRRMTRNIMKKIKLKIGGMHCTSCVMLIEGDLEDCKCVKNANCNYAKGECLVEIDDNAQYDEINNIVDHDGYKVLSMEEV